MSCKRLVQIILAVSILFVANNAAIAGIPQVYLIQNSGWMEPFFNDINSKLRPLVIALIHATSADDRDIIIASFNQSGAIPGEPSPKVIYKGKARPEDVNKSINVIDLPKRPDGKFADADFEGALNTTLSEVLNRQPAIIWMITNNKNDPNNSPDVIAHTKGFYHLLRDHPGIKRVIAIPVTMPTQGRFFREGGLMIYALSFGQTTDKLLEEITASVGMKNLFTKPPVRIKPLTEQPVIFEPIAVLNPGVDARIDKGSLILTGLESLKTGGRLSIKGKLNSNYYPQEIKSAVLTMDWVNFEKSKVPELPNQISPSSVCNLPPGGVIDNVKIDIQVPPLPTLWSVDTLLSNGYELSGVLRISLNELKMSLSPDFERQMNSIFGLGSLPEIFYPDKDLKTAQTLLPVRMTIYYGCRSFRATMYSFKIS